MQDRAPGAPLALLCRVAQPTRVFNYAPAATAALRLLALVRLMLAGVYLDTNATRRRPPPRGCR